MNFQKQPNKMYYKIITYTNFITSIWNSYPWWNSTLLSSKPSSTSPNLAPSKPKTSHWSIILRRTPHPYRFWWRRSAARAVTGGGDQSRGAAGIRREDGISDEKILRTARSGEDEGKKRRGESIWILRWGAQQECERLEGSFQFRHRESNRFPRLEWERWSGAQETVQ